MFMTFLSSGYTGHQANLRLTEGDAQEKHQTYVVILEEELSLAFVASSLSYIDGQLHC